MTAQNGDLIPALNNKALHSLMDPIREAQRLVESDEGFLVFLGLGAAYSAKEALKKDTINAVLVIDYDLQSIKELFNKLDYSDLFSDSRFFLLIDPNEDEIENFLLSTYKPVLHGGLRLIPLRSRTAASIDSALFNRASEVTKQSLDKISADYSVQAHFGKRWFSNTIKNLLHVGNSPIDGLFKLPLPPSLKEKNYRAAVIAAGPSLSFQIEILKQKKDTLYIIASDTSLPALLTDGIKADAVISIDCQHISYYHFMQGLPRESFLFLDLASPPSFAAFSKNTCFFSGSHPLSLYINKNFQSFPLLDISGGNVTYAALSLAEMLGARQIELYGADFSYPKGLSYARGTYIHPYFENKQNRFKTLEAQNSAFLYRVPMSKITKNESWYYESSTLRSYRERLEEKSASMEAELIPIEGIGAPIGTQTAPSARASASFAPAASKLSPASYPAKSAVAFLSDYHDKIKNLNMTGNNINSFITSLDYDAKEVFLSLLPSAAAIKKQFPKDNFASTLEKTKAQCCNIISRLISEN